MYREKRRNKIIILILIGIICLMGVGYAAFKTSINITGTTDISSSWDIKIISADVTDTNGTGENIKNTYNDLSASLEANLYEKGDYVEYSIIVENKGTFDAKLETIGITNSNNEAVKITSSGLTKGQTLYKNTTATLKVKIEYNSSYEGDASGTSGEAKIDLDFVQNSGGTIEPEKNHLVTYDYSTNGGTSTTAENEYINEGESINLSYTATKEGYEFVGWNTNSNAQEGLKELTMGTSDVTLYAIFRAPDTTPPVIENVSTSSTTNSIQVVVTATDEESGISKYEFKINDGEWIDNGTNNSYTFTGLTQDTGYEISVRVTNGVDLTAEEVSESIKLTDNVVTSGDGLYKDPYEDNVYTYRGASPNNYVTFNEESWRIISVNTNDNTIKIVKDSITETRVYDVGSIRYIYGNYCNNTSFGCNIWGSSSTLYNVNMQPITTLAMQNGGAKYALPNTEADLNTYLNTNYYNSLTGEAKNMITDGIYKVGPISYVNGDSLINEINYANNTKWIGKIALLDATEYIRASTDSSCINMYLAFASPYPCKNNNYLYKAGIDYVTTISPISHTDSGYVWEIFGNGGLNGYSPNSNTSIKPVVTLSSAVQIISGDGSVLNPYQLEKGISTSKLDKPTFSEEKTDTGKIITITYPKGEGLTYEYKKDNGNWQSAGQIEKVEFIESGTLVARVSDGVNIETASLTIKQDSAGSDLVENAGVVTSGDGLYKDTYEENVYTYRGASPNNYVTFNGEQWRIISVNTADNTIKIMRNSVLVRTPYDEKSNRTTSSNQYCNYSSRLGCNIYGSTSSLYNQAGTSKISMLAREVGGTAYSLPANESSLSTYLNEDYYDILSSTSRDMVKEDALYKSGVLQLQSGQTASTDISQVSAVKWKGKVGLIDATEYVRASTNSSCTGAYAYYNISSSGCRGDGESNWMFLNGSDYWTMSPSSGNTSYGVWLVYSHGKLYSNGSNSAGNSYGVCPVVTLKSSVKITSGNGSSSQPYQLTL